jgi:RNA polymerase sigma factor (TIGR02999 family)
LRQALQWHINYLHFELCIYNDGMSEVTRILNAIEGGDVRAAEELLPLVYQELRQLAAQKMSQEAPGQTLQATALVHEAYIRLIGAEDPNWSGRGHFFAAAAEAMRRILIDIARRKRSLKYGGDHKRVDLDKAVLAMDDNVSADNLIALDEALEELSKQDKVKADLVKLRYFAGLTGEQAAKILDISHSTADDHWAYAKAWLRFEITKGDEKA